MGQIIKTNTITSEEKDVRNAILYFGIAFYVAFYIFYSFTSFSITSFLYKYSIIFSSISILFFIGGVLIILFSKLYLINVKKLREAGWVGIIIGGLYIQFFSIITFFSYILFLFFIGGVLLVLYSKIYLIDVKNFKQTGWISIVTGGFYIQFFLGIVLLLFYFAFINDNTKNSLYSKILFYLLTILIISGLIFYVLLLIR